MNLHTPGKKPEWENIPDEERNACQRTAAATKGIVTPGNALTLSGYLITKSGFNDIERGRTGRAISKILVGRLFDVLDGIAADKTGTKSPQGEAFDAIADKKLIFDGLDSMGRHEIAPKAVTRSFSALSVANVLSAAKAKENGIEMHSSKAGKISTFIKWCSLIGYVASKSFEELGEKESKRQAKNVSNGLAAAAIGIGAIAAHGYFKKAFAEDASGASVQLDSRYEECEGSNYILGDELSDTQHSEEPHRDLE